MGGFSLKITIFSGFSRFSAMAVHRPCARLEAGLITGENFVPGRAETGEISAIFCSVPLRGTMNYLLAVARPAETGDFRSSPSLHVEFSESRKLTPRCERPQPVLQTGTNFFPAKIRQNRPVSGLLTDFRASDYRAVHRRPARPQAGLKMAIFRVSETSRGKQFF